MTGQFSEFLHRRDDSGRFSAKPAGESDVDLGLSSPGSGEDGSLPDSATIISADPGELDDYVYHDSWEVRADATANPHLTDAHVEHLTDPGQPVGVRAGMAMSWRPGVAQRLQDDPSPTVRAFASESWEYTSEDRARLASDPAVARIRSLLHA